MDIGIGLPNAVPGTTGDELIEWARRADDAGFSSLGTIDRTMYPNLEPVVALAAAAAVTDRIRLATTILIAPKRVNAALLAKQAASVHRISDGRMVLGVAPGGRQDDYAAGGVDFHTRGGRFDDMLERIKQVWAGSGDSSGSAASEGIGPDVAANPPQLMLGGTADVAFERAARYGDGWIMGGGMPQMLSEAREKLERAWWEAGRDGSPRLMSLAYFSLGEQAEENANAYIRDYYAWLGEYADQIVTGTAKDPDAVRAAVEGFEAAGCDELVMIPASSDPAQVDLLAGAALGVAV